MLVFSIYNCQSTSFSESKLNSDFLAKPASEVQKPYIALVGYGDKMGSFIKQNNLEVLPVFTPEMIIGKTDFEIDYNKLKAHITRIFPDPNATGTAFVNLEEPYILPIMADKINEKEFNLSLHLFTDVILYAKKMRPNVKWGHYGIPFTRWSDLDFIQKNDRLDQLFKAVDVLFPSVYIFFDDQDINYQKNYEYLSDNLMKALEIGIKYKKPVIPFVMHRFWSPNDRTNLTEMTDAFWEKYLKSVLSIHKGNRYVNGVVWWGADTFYYKSEMGKNMRNKANLTEQQFIIQNDNDLIHKGTLFVNLVKR